MKKIRNQDNSLALLRYVGISMETLWLIIVIGLPLAFASPDSMVSYIQLPKLVLLRLAVSALVVLWATEYVVKSTTYGNARITLNWHSMKDWLTEQPTRLVIVGATAFFAVYVLATLTSTNINASIWGNSRVWDGYSLYNMATYYVLFLVVATHLRSRGQLLRLLWAIALVGGMVSLLGIFERLNWIPLGTAITGGNRVQSTFGNPIFLGSFLVMTAPVTLGMVYLSEHKPIINRWVVLWVVLLAVQFLGMALTVSRGPIVGLVVSVVVFFLFGIPLLKSRTLIQLILVVGIAVAIALVALRVLPDTSQQVTRQSAAQALESRLFATYPQVAKGGLSNRISIWQASQRLIVDRPWFPFDSLSLSPLRPIVGYGPESFGYIFPIEAESNSGAQLHAHNVLVHQLVELGYLGGLALLALVGVILTSLFWLIRKSKADSPRDFKVISLAVASALVGRGIEQMVGVGRVSDLTLFWVLLAVITVLPIIFLRKEPKTANGIQEYNPKNIRYLIPGLALLLIVVVASIWLGVAKNINYFRADVAAANAYSEDDINDVIALIDKAVKVAPDVPHYYRYRADLLKKHLNGQENPEYRAQIAERIYVDSLSAWELEPLAVESVLGLANAAQDLNRLGYEGKGQEAIEAYQRALSMVPNLDQFRARLQILLAIAYVDSQQPEMSLKVISEALSLAPDEKLESTALYVQGAAFIESNETENAIRSLKSSLELDGEPHIAAQAHFLLADLYQEMGQESLSGQHRLQYEKLSQLGGG